MSSFEFYVSVNCHGGVFVKTAKFFLDQGGLSEPWGRTWFPVMASSIEHAREIGYRMRDLMRSET